MTVRANALSLPVRDSSVQCVITSPPYLGQRIYGDSPAELGRSETVADYVSDQIRVAKEVRRILKDDGLYWLNLGDKANGSGGAGGDYNKGGGKEGKPKYGKFKDPAYKVGQFLDVPGKVLAALQEDDWRLRQTIIWDKGQESRESLTHVNRPRTSHEIILLLAPWKVRSKFFPDRLSETGSVWHFKPAQAEKKGHAAPFPDELARRCIVSASNVGDCVVDIFAGSGTTERMARNLGRRGVGFDLYAGVP